MTMISGVRIMAAPCCGARFSAPRYLTMNFMAFAYWTDGWRENSLMPNGEGLRQCSCGRFLLLKDLFEIDTAESSDLPSISRVSSELLQACIAEADSEELEVAARLEYWRELNHAYRERYRTHRDAEEADNQATWEAENPDRRTWWDKFRGRKASVYIRTETMRFTVPEFEPSSEQMQNMDRLCAIFCSQHGNSHSRSDITLTELYREQGRFTEAQQMISTINGQDEGVTFKLIAKLIQEKQPALVRYRM